MKKIILTLIAAVAVSSSVFAQENFGNRRGGGQRMNATEMVKQRTERMVKQYNLTPEQAEAVTKLNDKYFAAPRQERQEVADSTRKERMDRRSNRQQPQRRDSLNQRRPMNMQRGGANMEEYNNELKHILNKDQWEAYENDMKRMRERFSQGGQRFGQGGPGGQRRQRRQDNNE